MAERRRRADLIMIFRAIILGNHPELAVYLTRSTTNQTRGHAYKLETQRTDGLPHVYRLSRRATAAWNDLPTDVVLSTSVTEFKRKLDEVVGVAADYSN